MTCTRCHREPGQPWREHAERVLCETCAALPPLVATGTTRHPAVAGVLLAAGGPRCWQDRPDRPCASPDWYAGRDVWLCPEHAR